METVFVAMSGGIDSAFTAYLLKQKGYRVVGITFQLLPETMKSWKNPKACCSIEAVSRAKRISDELSIPHYVINLRNEFEERVIQPFLDEYKSGRTPNPCVLCNKHIKFSAFANKALSLGADKIATGHYAVIEGQSSPYKLKKGYDRTKDQSYFLYPIEEDLLKHILFPLGTYTKDKVKEKAGKLGWDIRNVRESQDVCFIPENDCREFLSNHLQVKKGPIYNENGKLMGTHNGIHLYTIGQRRGLNTPYKEPLYVTEIVPAENRLVVGPRECLKRTRLIAQDINFFCAQGPDLFSGRISAKVRYRQEEEPCTFRISGDFLEVTFDTSMYSITPGQSVVVYCGDTVVGGGVITSSE